MSGHLPSNADPLKPTADDDDAPAMSVFTWIVAASWVFITGLAAYVIPGFEQIFKDFDTDLPWITDMVLWPPVYAWLAGGMLVAALLVLKSRSFSRRANSLVDMIALGVSFAIAALLVLALVMPLTQLMSNLSR
jgi:type II secretory pathway component PulF